MKDTRTEIDPPCDTPCAACPWLTANHRRPHADGWYTDRNRRRLWNGMRTGDAPGMTCHPTDPLNRPVGVRTRTRECAGLWIILARETKALEAAQGYVAYRKGRKLPMTRGGFASMFEAMLPAPLGRGLPPMTFDLSIPVSIGLGTDR